MLLTTLIVASTCRTVLDLLSETVLELPVAAAVIGRTAGVLVPRIRRLTVPIGVPTPVAEWHPR